MTNERYLAVSYFIVAGLSLGLGILAYFLLRRPFAGIANTASGKRFPMILKKLFPCGMVFPALLGFVSVSYQSCSRTTYEAILQDRSYLIQKNLQQISSVLFSILIAILFWDLVALLILRLGRTGRDES
jgi:uncharacterized membrane protein